MIEENSPTSDEKLMSALAHLFGPLGALAVWATQKDKSRFAKFQSLQALAFDGTAIIASGAFILCIFGVMFLGTFGSIYIDGADSSPNDIGMLFALSSLFPVLTFICVFPLSFLLLCARIFAAVSVIKGKDYRYPILGKWVERFLESK
jgi:uncharacterized Tic20 family protein